MKRKSVSPKMRSGNARKWRVPGGRGLVYGSMGGLVLLLGLMLLPITPASSSALGENETMTAGLNTKTTAYLYSTITLSTSGQVDIDIVPRSTGALGIGTAEVKVSTNNTTGYSMFLSTVDGTNRLNQIDSNLQYSGKAQDYYIDTLKQATTADSYLTNTQNLNTWGYALTSEAASGSTEYRGMTSTAGDQIYTTKGTSSNDSYNLNLAVAVDTTLPAGGYRNGLVITAVANPIILSGFNQIYYMQDMTPAVCESAEMESTAQLVDRRDNKFYWVAKLKDGNCWMTQNLALDLSTDKALTPEDSDVSSEWRPLSNTEQGIPEKAEVDYSSARSWNLGEVVLTNPTGSTKCTGIVTGGKITDCQWYKDVNGLAAGYNATETSSISPDNSSYDSHYLIGNYYQWNTVTVGSGNGVSSPENANVNANELQDAPNSICPKGWKLPTSGRYYSNDIAYPFERNDSFMKLLVAYGYSKGENGGRWDTNSGFPSAHITDTDTRLDYSPMYFTRSGDIDIPTGSLLSAGYSGLNWSSTVFPASDVFAYYFSFYDTSVSPSHRNYRFIGFPVRCLAR